MQKKVFNHLFIGRHNNDIDFTVPIIDYLAQDNAFIVHYLISTFEIVPETDYRLKYIKQYKNVNLYEVWDFVPETLTTKILKQLWFKASIKFGYTESKTKQKENWLLSLKNVLPDSILSALISFKLKTIHNLKRWLFKLTSLYFRKITWIEEVDKFMQDICADAVYYDWILPPKYTEKRKRPPYMLKGVYTWTKQNKIPVFSLPHGLFLRDFENQNPKEHDSFTDVFDLTFYENKRRKQAFVEYLEEDENKIAVSGASRYDGNWTKRLNNILPSAPSYIDDSKMVIVFYSPKSRYTETFNGFLDWVLEIAKLPNMQLIVQPHPRGQKVKDFKKLSQNPAVHLDTITPAPILTRHANAVSTLVSSVVVEAICLNIPLLYPKYLHSKITRFEEEDVCYTLTSPDQTRQAIEDLRNGWQPDAKKLHNFLSDTVYAGEDDQIVKRILDQVETFAHSFSTQEMVNEEL